MDNTSYTVRTYTGGAGEEFMRATDSVVIYQNTGALGAYLPDATALPGKVIYVVDASSPGVLVLSQQQLDGVPGGSRSIGTWAYFLSDGQNWFTLGGD